MKLYFVRHTSVDIPAGTCYGQTDVPLKSTFTEEALRVKEQLPPLSFHAIYSSPLTRCRQLAAYCGFDAVTREDARLKEMNFGDWEMQRWDDISDPNLQKWYADWINQPTTNGESFRGQYARVVSFLDEITQQGEEAPILVFTHGGVINCARIYFGLHTFENAFEQAPPYGEIVCFEF